MQKFVVFDLDGTLLNTLPDIAGAMNRVLNRFGLPGHPEESFKRFTGNGARKLCERALGSRQDMLESVYPAYLKEYAANSMANTHPYEGVPELLRSLTVEGFALIVYSNKDDPEAKGVVPHYFPDIAFLDVVGSLPDVPLKPDPTALLHLLAQHKLDSKYGVYLGDTVMDIRCAKAARLYAVAAGWGFQPEEMLLAEKPDRLIQKPDQLLGIISERSKL